MKTLDPKAARILDGAAAVFSEKGYHNASMRDVARAAGTSLAGMYYHFSSKEELLYSIQHYCFRRVLDGLNQRLAGCEDPRSRLHAFLSNHLEFFTENVRQMKVLSHESERLTGAYYETIAAMKREYFKVVAGIVDEFADADAQHWSQQRRRHTALALFGMVNWIYTWYDPERDGSADSLAESLFTFALRGLEPGSAA